MQIPTYIKGSFILLSLVLATLILYYAQIIIVPLIFSLFIAILLNPVVNFLVQRKIPRLIAISASLLLALIVVAAFVFFVSLQFSMFSKTYPQLKAKAAETSTDITTWASSKIGVNAENISQWIKNTESEGLKKINSSLGETLLTVGNALVVIVLVPVYVFLILFYKHLLLEFIRKLFAVTRHKVVVEVIESINAIIHSYLIGLLIEGVIVAILNSVALLILGIEYAILLGITGAILNVIPYIGGLTAVALPMVVAFVTKSWVSALLVMALYLVIQFIDNHYLVPYIVASKVKINALVAIVVVIVGNELWGVPGMFLAIPLVALVKVIFDHIDPLKPYGFLLGDNVPSSIRLPFTKKVGRQ